MKKIRILIISLVIILTLGCAVLAVLYFATDTFKSSKSNKDEFNNYIKQLNFKEFINTSEYANYFNRLQNENHSSSGIYSITTNLKEMSTVQTFNYSTNVDVKNKKANAQISLKQNGIDALTINYLKNEDFYGILLKDIVNQYIVIENNNLKEFAAKLGMESLNIPNKIEIPNESDLLDKNSLEELYQKYSKIIIEEIPEKCYSKLNKESIKVDGKEIEASGYELSISNEELQNILVKVLQNAKDDQNVLNVINNIISIEDKDNKITQEEYKGTIEEAIKNFEEVYEKNDEKIINIKLYVQGKDLVKLYAKFGAEDRYFDFSIEKINNKIAFIVENNSINLSISKVSNSEEQDNYEIKILSKEEGTDAFSFNINIERTGKLDSTNVGFNFAIEISIPDYDESLKYEFTNNTTLGNNVEIESFTNENSVVINNLSKEQLENLMANLEDLLSEKVNFEELFGGIFPVSYLINNQIFDSAQSAAERTKNAMMEEEQLLNSLNNEINLAN